MSTPKIILMIEDDPFVSDWVDFIIQNEFGSTCTVEWIRSEREFLIKCKSLEAHPPAAIILDLILPWEDGVGLNATDYPEPRGDIYEAGIRILEDVRRSPRLQDIPILLYTVSDKNRLEIPASKKSMPEILQKGDPDHLLIKWLSRKLSQPV